MRAAIIQDRNLHDCHKGSSFEEHTDSVTTERIGVQEASVGWDQEGRVEVSQIRKGEGRNPRLTALCEWEA